MEPGGIEWSTSSLFSEESGVIHRARSTWRSAKALGSREREIGKIPAADLLGIFAHEAAGWPVSAIRGRGLSLAQDYGYGRVGAKRKFG